MKENPINVWRLEQNYLMKRFRLDFCDLPRERPETSLPDFSLATNCDKKPVSCILICGDQTDVGFWQREGFLRSSWTGTQIYYQHEGGRACCAAQEGSFLLPAHVIGMAMNVEQEKLVSRNSCNAIEQKVFSFRCRRRRRPWLVPRNALCTLQTQKTTQNNPELSTDRCRGFR